MEEGWEQEASLAAVLLASHDMATMALSLFVQAASSLQASASVEQAENNSPVATLKVRMAVVADSVVKGGQQELAVGSSSQV